MYYYESICILNPELSSEESEKIQQTMSGIVQKSGGEIHVVDDWGVKRLAYLVKKQAKGRYVLMQFTGKAGTVQELERNYRVNDGVIKYMTLRINKEQLQAPSTKEGAPLSESTPQGPEQSETGE